MASCSTFVVQSFPAPVTASSGWRSTAVGTPHAAGNPSSGIAGGWQHDSASPDAASTISKQTDRNDVSKIDIHNHYALQMIKGATLKLLFRYLQTKIQSVFQTMMFDQR